MQTNLNQSKASRLRSARVLARLTRDDLEGYGIPANTLRMWENPREQSSGLTEKGANRIVTALKKSGVICTVEWLLHGAGEGPKTYEEVIEQVIKPLQELIDVPPVDWGEDEIIHKEIEAFRKINPTAITLRIMDDSMDSFLSCGDYVGGKKKEGKDIDNYLGLICIVELVDRSLLCRRLDKREKNIERYTLSCINPLTSIECPVLYDVEILSVAEVVWIRKKGLRDGSMMNRRV